MRSMKRRSQVSGIPNSAEASSLADWGWRWRIEVDVMIVIVVIWA
jgi:hypothetical protein